MKRVILAFLMILFGFVSQAQEYKQMDERIDKWGVPYVKLNNGVEMPRFGLGTFSVSNDDCKQACLVALKAGYRHIDTALIVFAAKNIGAKFFAVEHRKLLSKQFFS